MSKDKNWYGTCFVRSTPPNRDSHAPKRMRPERRILSLLASWGRWPSAEVLQCEKHHFQGSWYISLPYPPFQHGLYFRIDFILRVRWSNRSQSGMILQGSRYMSFFRASFPFVPAWVDGHVGGRVVCECGLSSLLAGNTYYVTTCKRITCFCQIWIYRKVWFISFLSLVVHVGTYIHVW